MVEFQVEFLKTLEDGVRLVPDLEKLEKVDQFKVSLVLKLCKATPLCCCCRHRSNGWDIKPHTKCICPNKEGLSGGDRSPWGSVSRLKRWRLLSTLDHFLHWCCLGSYLFPGRRRRGFGDGNQRNVFSGLEA